MLFQPPFLLAIAIGNIGYLTVVEWPQKRTMNRIPTLLIINLMFMTGFTLEFPSLYADTQHSIFHAVKVENKSLDTITFWASILNLTGTFLIDLYYAYLHLISRKISVVIIERIFQFL